MNINEKAFIIALIQEYSKIHKNIDGYEDMLDELESRKSVSDKEKIIKMRSDLELEIERLAIFRNVESEFWGQIEEKYGPGSFDPDTLEYHIKSTSGEK